MLYQQGQVDFLGVLIPTLAMMGSFGPCVALANLGSTPQNTFAAGNRVLDILEETPVVEEITGQPAVTFTGAEAKNVTFSYGGRDHSGQSLCIDPPGVHCGDYGAKRQWKSTLLKLFMRFWETQQGEIALSHTNVNRINTQNLREMESFVTQETHLFHDSIRRNLCIAKLDATQEELEDACRKASVHD